MKLFIFLFLIITNVFSQSNNKISLLTNLEPSLSEYYPSWKICEDSLIKKFETAFKELGRNDYGGKVTITGFGEITDTSSDGNGKPFILLDPLTIYSGKEIMSRSELFNNFPELADDVIQELSYCHKFVKTPLIPQELIPQFNFESITNEESRLIKDILTDFSNYRFAHISMFELQNISFLEAKKYISDIDTNLQKEPDCPDECNCMKLKKIVKEEIKVTDNIRKIKTILDKNGLDGSLVCTEFAEKYSKYLRLEKMTKKPLQTCYVLTTRYEKGKSPNIIALILAYKNRKLSSLVGLKKNEILLVPELKSKKINGNTKSLFDVLVDTFTKETFTNLTSDMQDFESMQETMKFIKENY